MRTTATIRRNTPRRANIATRRAKANPSLSKAFKPRRSVLFVPGSSSRMLEKARGLPCDVVVLDLEDSVAPEAKDAARRAVFAAVEARAFGLRETVVRINALSTPWSEADLQAVRGAEPDAIL